MGSYCVYIHTSPSGKKYVGQTCQIPEYRWGGGKNYYENLYFTNAINKYGWNSFSHEIIADELTSEQADKLECELIKKYNTTDPNFGYNIQHGGHGGQTHSEETKRRISESCSRVHRGPFSESHKQNISQGKRNKVAQSGLTDKQIKASMSALDKAHKAVELHKDEWKAKISASKKGRPGRVWTDEQRRQHSERMKRVYGAKAL